MLFHNECRIATVHLVTYHCDTRGLMTCAFVLDSDNCQESPDQLFILSRDWSGRFTLSRGNRLFLKRCAGLARERFFDCLLYRD